MTGALIATFDLNGEQIDVGSDWHYDLREPDIARRIVAHVKARQASAVLFCLGDLFDTLEGEDSSEAVSETLAGFAAHYETVVFTPGNHDLRGRERPWDTFRLPANVICPRGPEPVLTRTRKNRLLVANVFYDLRFIDPAMIGLGEAQIREFYAGTNDGRHFLGGDTRGFVAMADAAAHALTPEVDVLVTHALPHPSLVIFRAGPVTEDDEALAAEHSVTVEAARAFWNKKSIVMGSNILEHPAADFRDGLTIAHGHHHRIDLAPRRIGGRTVRVVTHQPNPWDPKSGIVL